MRGTLQPAESPPNCFGFGGDGGGDLSILTGYESNGGDSHSGQFCRSLYGYGARLILFKKRIVNFLYHLLFLFFIHLDFLMPEPLTAPAFVVTLFYLRTSCAP